MRNFTISVPVEELEYSELREDDRKLVDAACEATHRSYCPYSLSLIHISEPTRLID